VAGVAESTGGQPGVSEAPRMRVVAALDRVFADLEGGMFDPPREELDYALLG
jgi:hypothetical protein